MNRWIKISGIALAVLIVLALVLTLALPRLLDPNAYRDDLTRLVSEQTGRTLTLEGDLGVSVLHECTLAGIGLDRRRGPLLVQATVLGGTPVIDRNGQVEQKHIVASVVEVDDTRYAIAMEQHIVPEIWMLPGSVC